MGWRFLWNEPSPEVWCLGALGESSGTGHLRQGAASFLPRHTLFHPHSGSSESVCGAGYPMSRFSTAGVGPGYIMVGFLAPKLNYISPASQKQEPQWDLWVSEGGILKTRHSS